MGRKLINTALVLIVLTKVSNARLALDEEGLRRPFDQDLFKNVLDPVKCQAQVTNISQGDPFLLLRFLDAGIRIPRGVLQSNLVDFGNYHQCLGIDEKLDADMRVEGKYCIIELPTDQDIQFPQYLRNWPNEFSFRVDKEMQRKLEYARANIYQARAAHGFEDLRSADIGLPPMVFRLAVCIPKPCSTEEAISSLLFNASAVGFRFHEQFCRLPDDKPWVAADTVAVIVFSLIGVLTLLSTSYDLWHKLILNRDTKAPNSIWTSFSVYTNTHRLLTFKASKGALECLDGIRVLAMIWVIVGHTFMMYPYTSNMLDLLSWLTSPEALWISAAPITVDTFFMMAGVLLVYTSAGRTSRRQLICRLHIFYLNRLLRLLPALAALVLLEASVFHRMADGPQWNLVARNAQRCRTFWWVTLLHVQNYVTPTDMCIAHSWYVAIDIQLYIVSPVVLFWVLGGSRRAAWTALVAGLLAILTGATIFNFIMELPAGLLSINRWLEFERYMKYYYYNTLTRGSPFFVGMICGYILYICRGTKVKINSIISLLLWLVALVTFAIPFYTTYVIKQPDWDNQTMDNMINSFPRAMWAAGLGWLIFACVHGYAGPINWFLSLPLWKLPSRLSYAMYLYHFPIMFVYADTKLAPNYFTVPSTMYDSVTQFAIVLIVALIVTVIIEAPFSTLFKLMLEKGAVKSKTADEDPVARKNEVVTFYNSSKLYDAKRS